MSGGATADAQHHGGAMHAAARDGDVARLTELLEAGANPDEADDRGFTPLILASYNGHEAAAALLLARGAAVDAADAVGGTALMGVAFKGHTAIAARLLRAGATVDAPNETGRTPLMFAMMFGRAELAALLVQHGADPAQADETGGDTARHRAPKRPPRVAHGAHPGADRMTAPAALVTGAAQRLGGAIAQTLAQAGHPVALHCRHSQAAAERLAADIRAAGGRAAVLTADLADEAATAGLIGRAADALGANRRAGQQRQRL